MKKIISIILLLTVCFSTAINASAEGFESSFEGSCKSYMMVRTDNGEVIYSYNPDEELAMASLTKIMTYIVACENIENIETTMVTVKQETIDILNSTYSSLADLIVGEELSVLELLNMMMVPSGNDAALTLAMYYDELQGYTSENQNDVGVDSRSAYMEGSPFVQLMNDKAKELGCDNTNFTNPHGLYFPEHYSTARDLAVITQYATTLPYFTQVTGQSEYTLRETNMKSKERTVYNTNKMLFSYDTGVGNYYYKYATGIKTGSLTESGYCIAASATYEGYSYIVICLGAPIRDDEGNKIKTNGAMVDAADLFRWAFLNLSNRTIITEGTLLGDVDISSAWNQDSLQLVAGENIRVLLPKSATSSGISSVLDVPDSIQAPIAKGDVVGTVTYYHNGKEIANSTVVASESVNRSELVQTIEVSKEILTSPVFIFVIILIVIIIFVYILLGIMYNKKRKKARRASKYRHRK